tara:strand:- start:9028 stop:10542 length:1515 start_codon:yes stop_codon:yes gene_type:complete
MMNIKINPNDPLFNFQKANLFVKENKLEKAILYYNKTIRFGEPKLAFSALINQGIIFKKVRKFYNAKNCFKKAKIIFPQSWQSYKNLADIYFELEEYEKALQYYEKSEKKKNKDLSINKANTLRYLGRYQESRDILENILSKNSSDFLASYNLSNVYLDLGLFKRSLLQFKKTIEIGTDNYDVLNCYSRINFQLNIPHEFRKYHHFRCKIRDQFAIPILQKEKSKYKLSEVMKVSSKKILFYAEQGIGDEIFFSSLLNGFNQKNKNKIDIYCSKRLKDIFKDSFTNHNIYTEEDLDKKNKFQDYDFQLPIGSLLESFEYEKKSELLGKQYLFSDKNLNLKWEKKLEKVRNLKIGVSWFGGLKKFQQFKRNLPLDNFLDIFPKNVSLINLQHGLSKKKIQDHRNLILNKILDFKEINPLENLDDYFALVYRLDLIVTCDNSLAHIAGALGKKTFLLLPKISDYRWGIKSNKTPFYNSIRIFRQIKNNSWVHPFKMVSEEIRKIRN